MPSPRPARTTELTSAAAAAALSAAQAEASAMGVPVTVAVLDAGGAVKLLSRIGLPVVIDGIVVAGLGVAGAMTGAQDRRIAECAVVAAVAALAGSSTLRPGYSLPGEERVGRVRRRRSTADRSTSHDSCQEPTS